jgi:hypothetical protein
MNRVRRLRGVLIGFLLASGAFGIWLCWDDEPAGTPLASGAALSGSGGAIGLEQGWSEHTLQRAWHTSFGSRLLPRTWFLALERADDTGWFRDNDALASFGFLPQAPDPFNADGLPVGWTVDTEADHVGLTCAACHTGEIRYRGQRLRIAGGAGMLDITAFEQALLRALQATAAEPTKFARFAARLGNPPQLREQLEARIGILANRLRINRVDVPYGPGRMDAFGQIFNAVSAEFLHQPDNFHAPDAPVSIPSLWDTPRLDRVQWNGSSPNASIAPLVQNVTTALAVYGDLDLTPRLLGYSSSVDFAALGRLQRWNTRLRSPLWPEQLFGQLDRAAIARGREVYAAQCRSCHAEAERNDSTQGLTTVRVPLAHIGTDPRMADNFAQRQVASGALAGRHGMVWGGVDLGQQARAIDLVVHAALGATLQHPLLALRAAVAGHGSAAAAPDGDVRVYKAGPLAGIWATAPYLHNGSVPTLADLLTPPAQRPVEFGVGACEFDPARVGVGTSCSAPEGHFDSRLPGNSNAGHVYGTTLDADSKSALLEYLKSL